MKQLLASIILMSNVALADELIYNGYSLKDDEIPQMQPLFIKHPRTGEPFEFCTGTLIGPRVIVTAAHCVRLQTVYGQVTFGPISGKYFEVTLTGDPNHRVVDGVTESNDIAVGVLNESISTISPMAVSKFSPQKDNIVLYGGAGKPRPGIRQYGYGRFDGFDGDRISILGIKKDALYTYQGPGGGDSGGPTFNRCKEHTLTVMAVGSNTTSEYEQQNNIPEADAMARSRLALLFPNDIKDSFLYQYITEQKLGVCGLTLRCAPVKFVPKNP